MADFLHWLATLMAPRQAALSPEAVHIRIYRPHKLRKSREHVACGVGAGSGAGGGALTAISAANAGAPIPSATRPTVASKNLFIVRSIVRSPSTSSSPALLARADETIE